MFLFFDCFFCCNDFGLEKIFSFKIRQRGADEARREERSLRCEYVKMKVYILVFSLSLSAIKAALPRWISLFFSLSLSCWCVLRGISFYGDTFDVASLLFSLSFSLHRLSSLSCILFLSFFLLTIIIIIIILNPSSRMVFPRLPTIAATAYHKTSPRPLRPSSCPNRSTV